MGKWAMKKPWDPRFLIVSLESRGLGTSRWSNDAKSAIGFRWSVEDGELAITSAIPNAFSSTLLTQSLRRITGTVYPDLERQTYDIRFHSADVIELVRPPGSGGSGARLLPFIEMQRIPE